MSETCYEFSRENPLAWKLCVVFKKAKARMRGKGDFYLSWEETGDPFAQRRSGSCSSSREVCPLSCAGANVPRQRDPSGGCPDLPGLPSDLDGATQEAHSSLQGPRSSFVGCP